MRIFQLFPLRLNVVERITDLHAVMAVAVGNVLAVLEDVKVLVLDLVRVIVVVTVKVEILEILILLDVVTLV